MSRDGTVEEQAGRSKQGEGKGGEKQEPRTIFEVTGRVSAMNIWVFLQFQLSILWSVFFFPQDRAAVGGARLCRRGSFSPSHSLIYVGFASPEDWLFLSDAPWNILAPAGDKWLTDWSKHGGSCTFFPAKLDLVLWKAANEWDVFWQKSSRRRRNR